MRLQDQAPRRKRLREAESWREHGARQLTTASNDARSMAYTAPERKHTGFGGWLPRTGARAARKVDQWAALR